MKAVAELQLPFVGMDRGGQAMIQYAVIITTATGAIGCADASNTDDTLTHQLERGARRELQDSDGKVADPAGIHECILCWALGLAILAGMISALMHVCRHKRASRNSEMVTTPLSATAASANPFATDPASDEAARPPATSAAGVSALAGEGLRAKGSFASVVRTKTT